LVSVSLVVDTVVVEMVAFDGLVVVNHSQVDSSSPTWPNPASSAHSHVTTLVASTVQIELQPVMFKLFSFTRPPPNRLVNQAPASIVPLQINEPQAQMI
jgi:hypothetical protein